MTAVVHGGGAAALGFPSAGPRGLLPTAVADTLAGRLAPAALEARATFVRRARLACHARPGGGVPGVLATTGDFTVAGRGVDEALFVGAITPAVAHVPDGPQRALTALADGVAPRLTAAPLRLDARKVLLEASEARALRVPARTVLPGPVSLLLRLGGDRALVRVPELVTHYEALVRRLCAFGVPGVVLEEEVLALPARPLVAAALRQACGRLRSVAPRACELVLTASPATLHRDNLALAATLPVDRLHLDLVDDPDLLPAALALLPAGRGLALGLVPADGRRAVDGHAHLLLDVAVAALGPDRVEVTPARTLAGLDPDRDDEPDPPAVCARGRLREVAALAPLASPTPGGPGVR